MRDATLLFVVIGAALGWVAGRREPPWHLGRMIGTGGALGLVAFYVYSHYGAVMLIGGYLALALFFWGMGWLSNRGRRRR